MSPTRNQILGGLATLGGLGILWAASRKNAPYGTFSTNPIRQRVAEVALSQVGLGGNGSYMQLYLVPGDTVEAFYVRPSDPITHPPAGGYVFWCGIFALWVLHRAGLLPSVQWKWGEGFASMLPQTSTPKTGDIGYMDKWNHHDVVIDVQGDMIRTVDGNDGGSPGGIVTDNWQPKSKWAAFYSIAKLAGEQ
jgi:hypothetical protein